MDPLALILSYALILLPQVQSVVARVENGFPTAAAARAEGERIRVSSQNSHCHVVFGNGGAVDKSRALSADDERRAKDVCSNYAKPIVVEEPA